MFVSNSDTIRNKIYFNILDSVLHLPGTYVIARRKLTPDESNATDNSRFLDINMNPECNLQVLIKIISELNAANDNTNTIDEFFNLTDKQCQYNSHYEMLFEQLLYDLIVKYTYEFMIACESLEVNKKRNISIALSIASMVKDSTINNAIRLVEASKMEAKNWILTSIEKRKNLQYSNLPGDNMAR